MVSLSIGYSIHVSLVKSKTWPEQGEDWTMHEPVISLNRMPF